MSEIRFDNSTEEIKEMLKAQDDLLHEPSPQAARNFMHKYNGGEGAGMSDNVIMAALHKVRIRKGIDAGVSKVWLLQHGYKAEILYHGELV